MFNSKKNMISFVASNKKEILPYGICHLDSDGKFSNIKDCLLLLNGIKKLTFKET